MQHTEKQTYPELHLKQLLGRLLNITCLGEAHSSHLPISEVNNHIQTIHTTPTTFDFCLTRQAKETWSEDVEKDCQAWQYVKKVK